MREGYPIETFFGFDARGPGHKLVEESKDRLEKQLPICLVGFDLRPWILRGLQGQVFGN